MSPKLPRVTGAQLLRALERDGWYLSRQSGSHAVLRHPAKPGTTSVPLHAGKVLGPGLLSEILKDIGMTADELRRLL